MLRTLTNVNRSNLKCAVVALVRFDSTSVRGRRLTELSHSRTFYSSKEQFEVQKFPLPTLHHTVNRFNRQARSLQSDTEYDETLKISNDFHHDEQVAELQKLLELRAEKMTNWLTPWWLNYEYLDKRTPLPLNSSSGILFPKWNYSGIAGQVETAAKLINAAIQSYQNIIGKKMPKDRMGGFFLDMEPYDFIFGTTRVPSVDRDALKYGKDVQPLPKHIVVIRNNHLFRLPVFDSFGTPLSVNQISQLITEQVIPNSDTINDHPIGVITSAPRDQWAKVYDRLKKSNGGALQIIEDCLFVICLDNHSKSKSDCSTEDTQTMQCLHGGGCENNSCNRWFDKTLQFIIGPDGYCGVIHEQTPVDGPPVVNVLDNVWDRMKQDQFSPDSAGGEVDKVEEIDFELSDDDLREIEAAKENINAIAANTDVKNFTFTDFGKSFIKRFSMSPDSFIQIALSLTYYRIHHEIAPSNERGSLRWFKGGRTEVCRLPNPESAMFLKEYSDPETEHTQFQIAYTMYMAAMWHKHYVTKVQGGKGFDRHLLGLQLTAKEHNVKLHELYSCKAYKQMNDFGLYASQVRTRNEIMMYYGPARPEAYGICYNPRMDSIAFGVVTNNSCPITDATRFTDVLRTTLMDMKGLMEKHLPKHNDH
ncbi:hypothetical protein AB6A40_000027 [Gnathostoma spinigerum]|uniref:Choline/carnitine acyltransferase domain-containing protein n=1 Tax=Gnathostoma spinigerum TaxID=75299 RepID=A0ABD6E9E0_9BILA